MTLIYECDFCGRKGTNTDDFRLIEATQPVAKISTDKGHLCKGCISEVFD